MKHGELSLLCLYVDTNIQIWILSIFHIHKQSPTYIFIRAQYRYNLFLKKCNIEKLGVVFYATSEETTPQIHSNF